MNFLVTATEVYRVPTVRDAEELHKTLKNDSNFSLASFGYKTKVIKQKGEIIEEYQLVTVKKIFNEEKSPTTNITINYKTEVEVYEQSF